MECKSNDFSNLTKLNVGTGFFNKVKYYTLGDFCRSIHKLKAYTKTVKGRELRTLVGKTISPNFASSIKNIIKFDGTGKIVSIQKSKLSLNFYNRLCKNIVTPLSEKPQISKDKYISPGEGLVNIARVIKNSNINGKEKIERDIRNAWLSNEDYFNSLTRIVDDLKNSHQHSKTFIFEIDIIVNSIRKEFHITKANDNYYGRLFETELSKYIIENPTRDMLNVRNNIAIEIIDCFSRLDFSQKEVVCKKIAKLMLSDAPRWRANLNCVNHFLETKKPRDFIRMLSYTGCYSLPLILSLMIKYTCADWNILGAEIIQKMNSYYEHEIQPQRTLVKSDNLSAELPTTLSGVLLPYQKTMDDDENTILGKGVRPLDRYIWPAANSVLTKHDFLSLSSERATGIGMSGSSNILNEILLKLKSDGQDVSIIDGQLATAAWLCYSGGHSFNEAYSVFDRMNKDNMQVLSFKNIGELNASSKAAILHSYNKVIEASEKLNG